MKVTLRSFIRGGSYIVEILSVFFIRLDVFEARLSDSKALIYKKQLQGELLVHSNATRRRSFYMNDLHLNNLSTMAPIPSKSVSREEKTIERAFGVIITTSPISSPSFTVTFQIFGRTSLPGPS